MPTMGRVMPPSHSRVDRHRLRMSAPLHEPRSGGVPSDDRTSAEMLILLETLLSKAPVGFGFVDRQIGRASCRERV